MNPLRIEELKTRLTAMLDEIISEHAGGLEFLSDGSQALPDSVDQASMETDIKISLAMRERERQRARDIRFALRQIEDGTYGVCEECGEQIAVARLMAFPATTLCVHCKEALEQEEAYALAR